MLWITPPTCIVAQNDAYFNDNYDINNRNGTTGFSFDNFYNGGGLGFGNGGDGLGIGGAHVYVGNRFDGQTVRPITE